MSQFQVKFMWNGRMHFVTIEAKGYDYATRHVKDLYPGCSIIVVHRIGRSGR